MMDKWELDKEDRIEIRHKRILDGYYEVETRETVTLGTLLEWMREQEGE